MEERLCPWWVGLLLLSPFRKLLENPERMLGPFVHKSMTVLEPGCGMGFFTLPLAQMVGPEGRVLAVDLQPRMLSVLNRRAERVGLGDRIETRQAQPDSLGLEGLDSQVDLAVALHMVHEVPDKAGFLGQVAAVLRPGGRLLIVEPKGHSSQADMTETIDLAQQFGLKTESPVRFRMRWSALLAKS